MKQFTILYLLVLVTCEVRSDSSENGKNIPITAELEGTLKSNGRRGNILGVHGNMELNIPTNRKRNVEKPGLEFNGTLTLRKGPVVIVIGAHASFEAEDRSKQSSNNIHLSREEINSEENRLKRSYFFEKQVLGVYGQLNLKLNGEPMAIGMDASLSFQDFRKPNFEYKWRPSGPTKNDPDVAEFRATLSIATIERSEKLGVLFNMILKDEGIKTHTDENDNKDETKFETQENDDSNEGVEGRSKREEKDTTLVVNIAGRFGDRERFTKFEGEVKLWDLRDKSRPTPKQKLSEDNQAAALFEIDANITTKAGGSEDFIPVESDFLVFDASRTLLKRQVENKEKIEFSIDSEIQGKFGWVDRLSTIGLNADVELWKISTTSN